MATHYWISYRIHNNSTYDSRYEALRDAIEDAALREWKETTSFHLISSSLSINSLGEKLKAAIDSSVDRIVIRKLNTQAAIYIGKFNDLDGLKFFMDYAERV